MECSVLKDFRCFHPSSDNSRCLGCKELFDYQKLMDYIFPEAKELYGIDVLHEALLRRFENMEERHE